MASTENGTTSLSAQRSVTPSPDSGFDSGDDGATALPARQPSEMSSSVSGFDSGDDGATALPTQRVSLPAAPVTYYKMRAVDQSCAPSPPTYRTWVVIGSPDTNASQYSGAHCGAGVSFTDIVVVDSWRA